MANAISGSVFPTASGSGISQGSNGPPPPPAPPYTTSNQSHGDPSAALRRLRVYTELGWK